MRKGELKAEKKAQEKKEMEKGRGAGGL